VFFSQLMNLLHNTFISIIKFGSSHFFEQVYTSCVPCPQAKKKSRWIRI
jgi:hypothetical protein